MNMGNDHARVLDESVEVFNVNVTRIPLFGSIQA